MRISVHREAHRSTIGSEEGMMEFIILLIVVVVLGIASLRWGFDSTDDINSSEWERRKQWNAFYLESKVHSQPAQPIGRYYLN